MKRMLSHEITRAKKKHLIFLFAQCGIPPVGLGKGQSQSPACLPACLPARLVEVVTLT